MEITQAQNEQKARRWFLLCQFILRTLTVVFMLSSIGLMVTNKETKVVMGLQLDAKYSYSSSFVFFVAANAVASITTLLNLAYVFQPIEMPMRYLPVFIVDLMGVVVAVAGCAAAGSFGMVGKYGNSHTGWMPICDRFAAFCERSQTSIGLGVAGVVFMLTTTVISVITVTLH